MYVKRPHGSHKIFRLFDGKKAAHFKELALINEDFLAGKLSYDRALAAVLAFRDTQKKVKTISWLPENDALFEAWWQEVGRLKERRAHRAAYDRGRWAVKKLGQVSLLTGTKAQLQDKLRELDANSRRRAVAPLNTLLRWKGLDKVLTAPPADRPEPEYLTPQEVQAVVKAMKNPAERYACLAAFATGARYGELFAMTRFSLRGKSQTHIHIDKQRLRDWSLTRTKNGKIGNAFILKSYRANLLKWLDVDQKTKQEMRRIGHPYESFKMACATALGRDLTFHNLRHSYARYLTSKGATLEKLRGWMRDSMSTIEHYYISWVTTSEEMEAEAKEFK